MLNGNPTVINVANATETFHLIETSLEDAHMPPGLWSATEEELLAAIEEQQQEIFSRSLIIAGCMRRLRLMRDTLTALIAVSVYLSAIA